MNEDRPNMGFIAYSPDQLALETELLVNSIRQPSPGMAPVFTGDPMFSFKTCEEPRATCVQHWMIQGMTDPNIAGSSDVLYTIIGYTTADGQNVVVPAPGQQLTVRSLYEGKGYEVRDGYMDQDELPEDVTPGRIIPLDSDDFRNMFGNRDEETE